MDKATSTGFFGHVGAIVLSTSHTVRRPLSRSKERLVNQLLDELYKVKESDSPEKIEKLRSERELFRTATKLHENSRRTLKAQIAGLRKRSRENS